VKTVTGKVDRISCRAREPPPKGARYRQSSESPHFKSEKILAFFAAAALAAAAAAPDPTPVPTHTPIRHHPTLPKPTRTQLPPSPSSAAAILPFRCRRPSPLPPPPSGMALLRHRPAPPSPCSATALLHHRPPPAPLVPPHPFPAWKFHENLARHCLARPVAFDGTQSFMLLFCSPWGSSSRRKAALGSGM